MVGEQTYRDWEAIYRDNVERVYRLMFSKVGNRADAEDLTAEVFTTALKPLRTSASVPEVRAYLLAVARTALAAHWRRTLGRQITKIDAERLVAVFDSPELQASATERVEQILSGLTDRYQQILRLRFLDMCSVKEAAAAMGITVANAKVLQHRALREAAAVAERTMPPSGTASAEGTAT